MDESPKNWKRLFRTVTAPAPWVCVARAPNPGLFMYPHAKLWIATYYLPRDHTIRPQDIRETRQEIAHLSRSYLRNAKAILGHVTKRSIHASAAISPIDLQKPMLIRQGDKITIHALFSGIRVKRGALARIASALQND